MIPFLPTSHCALQTRLVSFPIIILYSISCCGNFCRFVIRVVRMHYGIGHGEVTWGGSLGEYHKLTYFSSILFWMRLAVRVLDIVKNLLCGFFSKQSSSDNHTMTHERDSRGSSWRQSTISLDVHVWSTSRYSNGKRILENDYLLVEEGFNFLISFLLHKNEAVI